MKTLVGALAGFVAGALVVFFLLANNSADEPDARPAGESTAVESTTVAEPEPTNDPTAAVEPPLADNELADPGGRPTPPADARPATVRRLADGDSFDITWTDTGENDEVRLFGVNAPEVNACFGQDARSVLDVLIGGDELLIETIERDEFFRVLGNVWVGDIFVNATMVELGAALTLSDGGEHAQLISDAQERAKASASGLWSPDTCGATISALRIVWIESDAPGRDDQNMNGEWIRIANEGSVLVDLTGWSIRDESTRHRYSFPSGFTLAGGAEVRVFSGCGNDGASELYWCGEDPVWNNGGDTGFLVDAAGRFVDTRSY